MSLGKDLSIGFRGYGNAIGFIFKNNLGWFFLIPIVFNILLFWGGYELIESSKVLLENYLLGWTHVENEILKWIISFLLGFIFKLLFFIVFTYTGGYIVIIVMSPILAYLSEKTEKIATGKDYPFNAEQLMRDVVRGILIALRNLFIELGLILGIFILGMIPILGWLIGIAGTVFLFIVSAYFYGFSFMDYSMERKKFRVSQSINMMRTRKGLPIANGSIFAFAILIPFCGVSLSGFLAIISAVAGSLSMIEVFQNEESNQNQPKITS